MGLEKKTSESRSFDPNKDLPRPTRIANNIIDFGGGGIVLVFTVGCTIYYAIKMIPETSQELYNNLSKFYQTISPYLESILNS